MGLTALVIQLELPLAAFTGLVPLVQRFSSPCRDCSASCSPWASESIPASTPPSTSRRNSWAAGIWTTQSITDSSAPIPPCLTGHTTLVFLLILLLTAVSGFVTDLTWLTPAQTLAGLLQGQQTVAAQSLHSFLYAVLAGIAANYISCNWIAHSMMRSLTKYPALRDPVLYGGVRHD